MAQTDKAPSVPRPQITAERLNAANAALVGKLLWRLKQKGRGAFLSRHEILGSIEEEHIELVLAVKGEPLACVRDELLDIAVGALFGVACIDAGVLHW